MKTIDSSFARLQTVPFHSDGLRPSANRLSDGGRIIGATAPGSLGRDSGKSLQVKQITVLLALDHATVRRGVSALLTANGRFMIVGEARTGSEAVEKARTLRPDVVVMGIGLPGLHGLDVARQILAANPAAKVMVISAHSDDAYVERLITADGAELRKKPASAEILTETIREFASGGAGFNPAIAKPRRPEPAVSRDRNGFPKARVTSLSSRESEVLKRVAEGAANKHIASELDLSIKTVEKHRQRLMDKLGIHETAGLTRYAIAAGVIENPVQPVVVYVGWGSRPCHWQALGQTG